MDCGWRKPEDDEITKTRAGKLTCAETAFAAELYKAGVYKELGLSNYAAWEVVQ